MISKSPLAQIRYEIKLPLALRSVLLEQSKRIPGCSRPIEGSEAHFIKAAVMEKLERCGVNVHEIISGKTSELIYRISSLK